ncbi:pilus assembly protein PilM [Patescibacteria group bacterium]|nr:pilus assembly protein PilM [Patescibacteria group bacterium]
MNFFSRIFCKTCLGIDIGAFSIKIIELSSFGKKKKLENYIKFSFPVKDSPLRMFHQENLTLLSENAAEVLNALFEKIKIKHGKAAFSLPDFSTFSTTFNLPPMTRTEVPQAIEFEARHHIPVPLSEVTFDWQIIEKKEIPPEVELKILLVAIPNKVLWNFQKMVNLTQIEMKSMEAEVFGLIRSSIPESLAEKAVCLVDVGWQSTTVSIVENKTLKKSRSFDISSNGMTEDISSNLKIDLESAEKLKIKHGLDPKEKNVNEILLPQINSLAFEIKKICEDFYHTEGRKVENVILAGGTATLFGLKEYLAAKLKKEVILADPFKNISFPSVLEPRLKNLGPSFAVAAGVALMGLET